MRIIDAITEEGLTCKAPQHRQSYSARASGGGFIFLPEARTRGSRPNLCVRLLAIQQRQHRMLGCFPRSTNARFRLDQCALIRASRQKCRVTNCFQPLGPSQFIPALSRPCVRPPRTESVRRKAETVIELQGFDAKIGTVVGLHPLC